MRDCFHRHDLVAIVPAVRRSITVEVLGDAAWWPSDAVEQLLRGEVKGVALPGIVSRQEGDAPGLVGRVRLALSSKGSSSAGASRRALLFGVPDPRSLPGDYGCAMHGRSESAGLRRVGRGLGAGIGGRPALRGVRLGGSGPGHWASILPRGVRSGSRGEVGALDAVERFHDAVCALSRESGVAIDVELELPDGAGIKLAELSTRETPCLQRDSLACASWAKMRCGPWIIDISSRSKGERNGC